MVQHKALVANGSLNFVIGDVHTRSILCECSLDLVFFLLLLFRLGHRLLIHVLNGAEQRRLGAPPSDNAHQTVAILAGLGGTALVKLLPCPFQRPHWAVFRFENCLAHEWAPWAISCPCTTTWTQLTRQCGWTWYRLLTEDTLKVHMLLSKHHISLLDLFHELFSL